MHESLEKAYIVAVDMGYGHQRAVFPLEGSATTPKKWGIDKPSIISANRYPGITKGDRRTWENTRRIYEWMSRMTGFPFFGKRIFHVMNYFEKIDAFYPHRDLSRPTLVVRYLHRLIQSGFGKHLIDTLNEEPLPFLTSFFIPAFCAEEHGYKGQIYCLCTDSDISRVWVPHNPKQSRIIYLAPNHRVGERLKQYGILPEKIVVTGFPLPKENTGDDKDLNVLRKSLARRVKTLDPKGIYQKKYKEIITLYLDHVRPVIDSEKMAPLTITFAVGGAGAQSNIGVAILKSLAQKIKESKIRLNLVAGSSMRVQKKYLKALSDCGLKDYDNIHVRVIYNADKYQYFREFQDVLCDTDILWTKPSELSFYAGLGLPIVMTPPLGVQEEFNRSWLHTIGAGIEQEDPRYCAEWLFDWLDSGWLAEAAMNGFIDAPKRGTFHIENLILHGTKTEIEDIHFL